MGMGFGGSAAVCEGYIPVAGQPRPDNFNILKSEQVGEFLVLMLQYPDCTNFEGKKILVMENMDQGKFRQMAEVDPHFSKDFPELVARFRPTCRAWHQAIAFCRNAPK